VIKFIFPRTPPLASASDEIHTFSLFVNDILAGLTFSYVSADI